MSIKPTGEDLQQPTDHPNQKLLTAALHHDVSRCASLAKERHRLG